MKACPQCSRPLLSQASVRCNWCGKAIDDTDYQANARVEREAYFAHQAQHDAHSLANTSAINISPYDSAYYGPPAFGTPSRMPAYQHKADDEAVQKREQDSSGSTDTENCENELPQPPPGPESQGRFQHLEW